MVLLRRRLRIGARGISASLPTRVVRLSETKGILSRANPRLSACAEIGKPLRLNRPNENEFCRRSLRISLINRSPEDRLLPLSRIVARQTSAMARCHTRLLEAVRGLSCRYLKGGFGSATLSVCMPYHVREGTSAFSRSDNQLSKERRSTSFVTFVDRFEGQLERPLITLRTPKPASLLRVLTDAPPLGRRNAQHNRNVFCPPHKTEPRAFCASNAKKASLTVGFR